MKQKYRVIIIKKVSYQSTLGSCFVSVKHPEIEAWFLFRVGETNVSCGNNKKSFIAIDIGFLFHVGETNVS